MLIELKKLTETAVTPQYKSAEAAAMDLYYDGEEVELHPGTTQFLNTGIAVHIDNPGVVGVLAVRSSISKRGVCLANAIGIIDSDYQGELKVGLINNSNEMQFISKGERFAQIMFLHGVVHPTLNLVEEFSSTSERGVGGVGSTGSK